jgi:hypothetical protein
MKTIRFIGVVLAITLFVSAFAPVAGNQKSLATSNTILSDGPVEALFDATQQMPLFSPLMLSASAPVVVMTSSSAGSSYACLLVSQSPADWTQMGRRHYFTTKWTLKNIGTKVWGKHGVDVKFMSYTGGAKMHDSSRNLFDLPSDTGQGKKITLSVYMTSPKNPGYYTETWGLFTGSNAFCRFSIAITVTH